MDKQKANRIITDSADISAEKNGETLNISFSGNFDCYESRKLSEFVDMISASKIKKIVFSDAGIKEWDSSLLLPIYNIIKVAKIHNVEYDIKALPDNLQKLLILSFAVDRKPSHGEREQASFLETVGENTEKIFHEINKVFDFLGDTCSAFWRSLIGKSLMRGSDFGDALNECGPKAMGIVMLISFLVGLILAFVGAVQLKEFGAQIYVSSLVTIGMCRIMGAIMVGIIMAGRTGSAYAATIGTMQVNEELDALQTMGFSITDFLVLPRIFALVLAMPILTMTADFMGMVGGAAVGVFMLDIPYQEYWNYSLKAFTLSNFLVGIFHGICFGLIIAVCGCYQGVKCGRNADSVGIATTKSVVNAVVIMIVATGIITVICQELGI